MSEKATELLAGAILMFVFYWLFSGKSLVEILGI